MWNRVFAVFRAGLGAHWGAGRWPAGPLVTHTFVAGVLCGLVRAELPPFGYGVFALTVSAALVLLPLLGDLGLLLRADPASEWVEALPVRRSELRLARTGLLLTLLWALALPPLVAAAALAPPEVSLALRLGLVVGGLAQATLLAALVLALQGSLGRWAAGGLVVLQTAIFVGVLVGLLASLRWIPALRELRAPEGAVAWLPPAWFAAPLAEGAGGLALALPWLVGIGALGVLALVPAPPAPGTSGPGVLGRLLAPVRGLARRLWVRRGERASFDLVFDALPLEREFVLRTYPLIGVPLAFLLVGAGEGSAAEREGLLALLLFTPPTYLPILLAHVPTTASPGARWILDTAPVRPGALRGGVVKALAVRFLLPLYAALAALTWLYVGPGLLLRLALPGALLSLVVLRLLYPRCVFDPPLSRAPDEVSGRADWMSAVMGLGIGLTVVAVAAQILVATPLQGLALAGVVLAVELALDRRDARS